MLSLNTFICNLHQNYYCIINGYGTQCIVTLYARNINLHNQTERTASCVGNDGKAANTSNGCIFSWVH